MTQRRQALQRLRRALPKGVELLTATAAQLASWQASLSRRLSARTVKAETCNVTAFYAWAHEADLIAHDPARKLVRPKTPKTQPRPIPECDLAIALRAAAVSDAVLFVWLCLAGYRGLRAVEISRVGRADLVEGLDGAFLVTHGKGARDRVVPVPADILEHLKPHLHGRGQAFRRPSGVPTHRQQLLRRTV